MKRALLLVALLGWATLVLAEEKLWQRLEGGGHVVLIRHTITTPGTGDPPGFRLEDCATQRNLTDEGRGHARRIGAEFRKRKIPVGRVLASPWCRCVETAKLAFGRVDEISTPLSNLFGRPENRERQLAELKKLIAQKPRGNLVLVTHGSVVQPLTGIAPATGELVVVSQGEVLGRLTVD